MRWMILVALCSFLLLFCPNVAISQAENSFYPAAFACAGATRYVSGSLSDLQANDGVCMTFQSGPTQVSPQSLYAHQETTTLAGATYYVSSLDMADMTGTDLSMSLSPIGRRLLGEFVYPLTGVTSVPSSTWAIYYRGWLSNLTEKVSVNSPSWVPNSQWKNAEYAYSSDDTYANSSTPVRQEYGGYGFILQPTASITKVEVGYEAYAVGDEKISVGLSVDGGVQWIAEYNSSSLGTIDQDIVSWIDFTTAANWTASMFSDSSFRAGVKSVRVGLQFDDVLLDWLPVKVTYVESPPSVHMDVDIQIRRSDGAIRQTLATNVANSESLSTTVQTLSGTFDWPDCTVVNQTDYLCICYYADILGAHPEAIAYTKIDDATSLVADQTRVTNVILPSEYAVDLELSGHSDTNDWSKIVWTIDSSWTTESVLVTLQLYDYSQGIYPSSGNGYIVFSSSSVPNAEGTKTQTITINMTSFRDYSGDWKMRMKGVKPTTSQFSLNLDLSTYQITSIVYHDIAVLGITCSPTSVYAKDIVGINVTVKNKGETSESFNVTTYHNDSQIGKQTVTNLMSNESTVLTFVWNTSDILQASRFQIQARIDVVPGETEIADNEYYGGYVDVLPAKDAGLSSAPWNWTWVLLGVPFLIPLFVGIAWKKRKTKSEHIGIEYLNKITDGGIPDSFSVMLVGGSDSGKSVMFQELAYLFLKMEKPCVYVVYECFPDEIRENMKKFQWDTSIYESRGEFSYIDCYSSTAKVQSREKRSLNQPFSLVDLGISVSSATNEAGNGVKVFLDSIVSLLTQLDPSRVVDFLQDRIARLKGVKGNLIFTLNKESVDPALMSRLEESVDGIIEFDANQVNGEIVRRLRIKKMRGRNPSEKWVRFEISPQKGVVFPV